MEFSEIKREARLENATIIESFKVTTRSQCMCFCAANTSCKSYNFCGKTVCELSSEDIYSDFVYLGNSTECLYGGMPRESVPRCVERGRVKLITDDKSPGICEINEKRQDCKCGMWQTTDSESNQTHWITHKFRPCQLGSHIYEVNCSGNPENHRSEQVLLFPEMRLNFWQAVDFCRNRSAQLYGDVDGSRGQVQFLYDLDGRSFWYGVTDIGHEMVWKSFRGETLNSLILPLTYGDVDESTKRHMIRGDFTEERGYFLKDNLFEAERPFACQLIYSELTQWVLNTTLIDNSSQLTIHETRDCFNSSTLSPGCLGELSREVTYFWVSTAMTWSQAKLHCQTEFEGSLFSDLEGTEEQDLFLAQHMQFGSFWIGITDERTEGSFVNIHGQDMAYIGQNLLRLEFVTGDDTLNWLAFWDTVRLTSTPGIHVIREVGESDQLNFVCYKTVLL